MKAPVQTGCTGFYYEQWFFLGIKYIILAIKFKISVGILINGSIFTS